MSNDAPCNPVMHELIFRRIYDQGSRRFSSFTHRAVWLRSGHPEGDVLEFLELLRDLDDFSQLWYRSA
jgi:hypothetical protein